MAVVTETINDSAPMPNTSRPAAITASVPVVAVIAPPRKQSMPNSNVAFFTPIRSITIPPTRTMMMFGTL